MSLFAYHSGMRALVCPAPDGRTHFGVSTAAIRAAGWTCDDEELRKALPRADAPTIHAPNAGQIAAVKH
jgi:hypothetical protein